MPFALLLLAALGAFGYYVFKPPSAPDDPAASVPAQAATEPAAASGVADLAGALGREIVKLWSPPASAEPYLGALSQAEQKYGLPPQLLTRQLDIESDHFAPDVVNGNRPSRTGAIGIGQFEPATSTALGIDPTSPSQAIDAAAKMMRRLFDKFGSWEAALAAYNWGEGHVQRQGLAAAPQETKDYINAILGPIGLA
jgi:hypothetical protein